MLKQIINKLRKFCFPILYLLFFVEISGYGQNMFHGLGISFILSIIFFAIFFIRIKKIPKNIIKYCFILIAYITIMTIIGEDYINSITTLGNVIALFLLIKFDLSNAEWKKSFMLTGIIGAIILYLHKNKMFLNNWNNNTVGMFCAFGIMGFIISYKISDTKLEKIINMFFIVVSFILLLYTDNRNALMMYLIAFISNIVIRIEKVNGVKFNVYSAISLGSPAIITLTINKIANMEFISHLLEFSNKIFGKSTFLSGRDEFWIRCENYIGNHWIFGTGQSLYNIMYSHNMFYSTVYFLGITGYLIYALLILNVIKVIMKNAKNYKDELACTCTLIFLSILFGQIMENVLFTSDYNIFIPYLFLSIGLARAIKKEV